MYLPKFTGVFAGLAAGVLVSCPAAAVVMGQRDDFQGGNTAFWSGGGPGPMLMESGGPEGAGDRFMMASADGSSSGGRLSIYNREQWLGDYNTAGITAIEMDLKNFSTQTLSMRIGFKLFSSPGSPGIVTRTAVALPADGAWHHLVFPLSDAAMQVVGSPAGGLAGMLGGNAAEFRILHSTTPVLTGNFVTAQLGVDNVTAVPAPGTAGLALLCAGMLGRRRRV